MVVQRGEGWLHVSDDSRVWITLPNGLLSRLDEIARGSGITRDAAVKRAVEAFVYRSSVSELSVALERGYQAMADLNLDLAEEDDQSFLEWNRYERRLAEAETSGDS